MTLTSYQLEIIADKVARITSPILTVKGLSEMLGISQNAVRKRMSTGALPYHKSKGSIYFSLYEINKKIGRETSIDD
jgi:hypothetical protein